MADYFKNYLRLDTPPSPASEEADFADFAAAPVSISSESAAAATAHNAQPTLAPNVAFTKWYRVWERTSPQDFIQEAVVLPFVIIVLGLHFWGRRKNRRIANRWAEVHLPALEQEFAVVGLAGKKLPSLDDVQSLGLLQATTNFEGDVPDSLLKEKTAQEFVTYATGRQNVAFVDIKLSLFKRHNPLTLILEYLLSFFFDSARPPMERMEATAYTFDGREKDLVPRNKQDQDAQDSRFKSIQSSAYDGFVWAVVHKDHMRYLREDRYDLSLTSTKDSSKLPLWTTVMTENAEITESILTPDLIKAVESAGDEFEYLIITDQPIDKPQKLKETTPRKRLSLSLCLQYSPEIHNSTLPIFNYFLRLPDLLASHAHYRPEVLRKLRSTRKEEMRKLLKVGEVEKAEKRRVGGDKKRKQARDQKLKAMSAEEQRKFLEREREKGNKKQEKRMTRKA